MTTQLDNTATESEVDDVAPHSSLVRRHFLNPAFDQELPVLDTQRTSQYYAKPAGRRISEYEQVLLYAQPSPDWIPGGLGFGGWKNRSVGGRGAWENYFTEAKSSDWFAFRDPGARWQRPYTQQKAEEWEEFQRLLSVFGRQGLHRDIDDEWLHQVIPTYFGAYAHHEYGLQIAHASTSRDALTDVMRVAFITGALDHLDNAEMIQAVKVALSQVLEGFSAEVKPGKDVWMADPIYKGARAAVEEIWGGTYDFLEAIFAIYMIYEPLFGSFARQQFFSRAAAAHGDVLTSAVISSTLSNAEIDAQWAFELFERVLAGDPKFGAYNKQVMQMWAEKWLPITINAMADFAPMFTKTKRLRDGALAGGAPVAADRVIGDWVARYAKVFDYSVDQNALVGQIAGTPTPTTQTT
ncbi:toluene hydroxylase (plasmid) [Rhodococcus sp. ZPP]|uniref:toluene hydroxylase n=1 Tax=Rhodococcus TaxID=1827 RepID=UPI001AD89E8D|nr:MULTISPECIES: toluene hydroxylase [Rhodococcus]MBO8150777.1 toluene hydroxylase [Rhodococcus erythropolis]QTJ70952.1 toluene hydroxylase [Rhodococcus sp. ZPP]